MSTFTAERAVAQVLSVTVTDDTITVDLSDGRTVSVPVAWYPRIQHATSEQRQNWCLIGGGEGIHWPDLDEDFSLENVLMGKASGESQASFKRWLEERGVVG